MSNLFCTVCGEIVFMGLFREELEKLGFSFLLSTEGLKIKLPPGWSQRGVNGCARVILDEMGRKVIRVISGNSKVQLELMLDHRIVFRTNGRNGSTDLIAIVYDRDGQLMFSTYPERVRGDLEIARERVMQRLQKYFGQLDLDDDKLSFALVI